MTSDDITTLTISSISISLRNKTSQACHLFSTISAYIRLEGLTPNVTHKPPSLAFPRAVITRIAHNASNKLQLKEKQAMRVCSLHPV